MPPSKPPRRVPLPALPWLGLLLVGCGDDCARPGCRALSATAAESGPGVAGVVALESDLNVDGCSECPLAEARLEVWSADGEIASEAEARATVAGAPPAEVLEVAERFVLPLDPGSYLLCVRPSCVALQIADSTTTVNVKRRNGPTSFFVADGQSGSLAEREGMDVGFEL